MPTDKSLHKIKNETSGEKPTSISKKNSLSNLSLCKKPFAIGILPKDIKGSICLLVILHFMIVYIFK